MNTTKAPTVGGIVLCSGQCGGEVVLVTDGVEAYAYVDVDPRSNFIEQDCDGVVKRHDGTIVVHCSAIDPAAEQVCDGTAIFTDADLAPGQRSRWMRPMDEE